MVLNYGGLKYGRSVLLGDLTTPFMYADATPPFILHALQPPVVLRLDSPLLMTTAKATAVQQESLPWLQWGQGL